MSIPLSKLDCLQAPEFNGSSFRRLGFRVSGAKVGGVKKLHPSVAGLVRKGVVKVGYTIPLGSSKLSS